MEFESLNFSAARKVASLLQESGFEAYIIGGAVRDLLLGVSPKDFDLTTNALPEQIIALDGLSASSYKDTAQAFGVTRVVVEVESKDGSLHRPEIEIATYRQDIEAHLGRKHTKIKFASLSDDIKRRDFTINAIAFDPITSQIIDEVGGLNDIADKLIRFIGEPQQRIKEDPLRLLRGIRLRNQLDFKYDPHTKNALINSVASGDIEQIATERIKTELTRILMHPNRTQAVKDLDRFGINSHLLPELSALKDTPQPPKLHAEGDVFTHTLLALSHLPDIISPRLAWATLLHDIGKASTQTSARESGDRIRFSGHHRVGAEIAEAILLRLHFDKKFIADVTWMIHFHLGIDDLPSMRPRKAENFMHHPAFADLLELHKADAHASWSVDDSGAIDSGPADFSKIEKIWRTYQKQKTQHAPSLKRDLAIDGEWVMDQLSMNEGSVVGEALSALESAYLEHEIENHAQAEEFLRVWIRDREN